MNITEPSKTQMGRILCRDDEESLLKAIAAGEIFGFLVCDVSTPEHLIKEYEAAGFLFPPVIQRMDITEDHLSPFMRQRYIEEQRKPQTTVVQTYNGSGVFVLSSMVQFWMERGMKITNVKKFIQYQPGCALEPFVQKVSLNNNYILFLLLGTIHLPYRGNNNDLYLGTIYGTVVPTFVDSLVPYMVPWFQHL